MRDHWYYLASKVVETITDRILNIILQSQWIFIYISGKSSSALEHPRCLALLFINSRRWTDKDNDKQAIYLKHWNCLKWKIMIKIPWFCVLKIYYGKTKAEKYYIIYHR